MSSYRPLAEILDSETPRRMPFRFAPISDDELSPAPANSPKFVLEPWATIDFAGDAEWLVKRLLPRRGVAVLYGKSGTLKSFVASYLAMFIAIGWDVAGRRVTKAPAIYVAAEGSSGLRKRKVGFAKHYSEIPVDVAFSLVAAAPNLGTGTDDLKALIAAMSPARPGLIVLDTLAQSLGAGDENGGGMVQLVANATALANHFDALVLIVHHSGLADDKRMRGSAQSMRRFCASGRRANFQRH
jgi:RecA-family ATPase